MLAFIVYGALRFIPIPIVQSAGRLTLKTPGVDSSAIGRTACLYKVGLNPGLRNGRTGLDMLDERR